MRIRMQLCTLLYILLNEWNFDSKYFERATNLFRMLYVNIPFCLHFPSTEKLVQKKNKEKYMFVIHEESNLRFNYILFLAENFKTSNDSSLYTTICG